MQAMYIAPSARPMAAEFAEALSYVTVKSFSRSSMGKTTAVIGGILIAGGIIWWLMQYNGQGASGHDNIEQLEILSLNIPATAEKKEQASNAIAEVKKSPLKLPEKAVVSEPVRSGAFFYDAAPSKLRNEWRNARGEVRKKGGLRGQGALLIDIPADTLLRVKRRLKEVFRMDARFEKRSCLYRLGDEKLTLELYHENWDKPKVYHWQAVAGKADVFQPVDEENNEKIK